jgi:DNA (cytosine-5)-methyltransferase 1
VVEILEKDLGYSVAVKILLAADFGVPQLRERAFFIARANGAASFPEPTHANPASLSGKRPTKKPWVTVKDALADLPAEIKVGECFGGSAISRYVKSDSKYAKSMQSKLAFPYGHVTREYRKSVVDLISEMRPGQTWDAESTRMVEKYNGMVSRFASKNNVSKERAHLELVKAGKINQAFYKDYYWSAYTRLAWDAPALTITANANFLGSGRFTHPVEMRGITVREAARLQSFDDDFRFITSDEPESEQRVGRIGVAMDMIGEAVPPVLAQALAGHIAAQLA